MTQGITLYSISHPVAPWYKRLWRWVTRKNDINEESLETIEIELYERQRSYGCTCNTYQEWIKHCKHKEFCDCSA